MESEYRSFITYIVHKPEQTREVVSFFDQEREPDVGEFWKERELQQLLTFFFLLLIFSFFFFFTEKLYVQMKVPESKKKYIY